MNRKKKLCLCVMLCVWLMTGCRMKEEDTKKVKEIDFTIVEEAQIPRQVLEVIEQKKNEPFQMTYKNPDHLYIVRGYGEKDSGGYSICVKELYLSENCIVCDTELLGPETKKAAKNVKSYPYVVVKIPAMEYDVVFH